MVISIKRIRYLQMVAKVRGTTGLKKFIMRERALGFLSDEETTVAIQLFDLRAA